MQSKTREQIIISLEKRLFEEAYQHFKIPDTSEKDMGFKLFGLLQAFKKEKPDQYMHSLRIPLYTALVFDFLGVKDKEYHKDLILSQMIHDLGKLHFKDLVDKKQGFTKENHLEIRNHIGKSMEISRDILERLDLAEYAGSHHLYQPNSYPKSLMYKFYLENALSILSPKLKETSQIEEKIFVAKITGIIDYYDAAATRRNERNGFKSRGKGEVKEELKESFHKIRLNYNGEKFKPIKVSAKDLIETLYQEKIFGREDIDNPFKTPYSFLYNP